MKILVLKAVVPDYLITTLRELHSGDLDIISIGELDVKDRSALLRVLRSRKDRSGWVYVENIDIQTRWEQIQIAIESNHYSFRFYEVDIDELTKDLTIAGVYQVDPIERAVNADGYFQVWEHPDLSDPLDRVNKIEVRM
jgi:hypothetical protein